MQEQQSKRTQQRYDGDQLCQLDQYQNQHYRASSAPPGPLSELAQFKRSNQYKKLQQAIICSNHMIHKTYEKFDLESPQGQNIFKRYLKLLQTLCQVKNSNQLFHVVTFSRQYRNKFSNAYKILYEQGCLCYLTQILDSAQQGFPYLWVNGEKYLFSQQVLDSGSKLVCQFFKVQHVLRNAYAKISHQTNCSLDSIKSQICTVLQQFDFIWTKYQKGYITELMAIEKESRRFIVQAIQIQNNLNSIEIRQKFKGRFYVNSQEYIRLRKKLCKIVSNINSGTHLLSVANIEGKGRDDLDFQILEQAQGIMRRVTKQQSASVRILADKIRTSFNNIRHLLRKYQQNIQMVDPQLRNNPDLVQALVEYQNSWEKGKNYFLDPKKEKYLIHFSHIIETTSEKYPQFKQKLENRQADIFMSIPSLLVLKNLDHQDKNICFFFLPQLNQPQSKIYQTFQILICLFNDWKKSYPNNYLYYNIIEKLLIGEQLKKQQLQISKNFESFTSIINKIKLIAMDLQRSCPLEWNNLLDASLALVQN